MLAHILIHMLAGMLADVGSGEERSEEGVALAVSVCLAG